MSAVSINVTPSSRARLMVATDSSQSVAPYHSLIPMQPRPWADTLSSPSLTVRMCWFLLPLLLAGLAARVGGDLRVEQLQAFPLGGEGAPHLVAVVLEQLEAFGLACARPDQLGVPLHVADRHPGGAQLDQQRQPFEVVLAVAAASVAAALHAAEQPDALVPAQRVL